MGHRSPMVKSLLLLGVILCCTPSAGADEWVQCRRDSSTGQLLWTRGKSQQPLETTTFEPEPSTPDVGRCRISHQQLRQAHGLSF